MKNVFQNKTDIAKILLSALYCIHLSLNKNFLFYFLKGSSWTYSNWKYEEPNNYKNSDCMVMADYYDYQWDDVQCECKSDCYPLIYTACMAPCTKQPCP